MPPRAATLSIIVPSPRLSEIPPVRQIEVKFFLRIQKGVGPDGHVVGTAGRIGGS